MARAFASAFAGPASTGPGGVRPGFFASVDGAPAEGYRAPRTRADRRPRAGRRPTGPVTVLTGHLRRPVLAPLVAAHPRTTSSRARVDNDFFGGNIGVAGLLAGEDLARVLADEPDGHRYLLPDACLSRAASSTASRLADLPAAGRGGADRRRVAAPALDGTSFRPACAA